MIDPPKLIRWHFWSILAVITARLETRLTHRPWLHRLKWWFLDRANDCYLQGFDWFIYSGSMVGNGQQTRKEGDNEQ